MLGIFGGTFDPIHYGHLKPVQVVLQELGLSKVRFVPNRLPPHRGLPWLSTEQRVCLLEIALQAYPDFILDRRELNRDGPSYMVDTLKSLREDFPQETLCLIMGMDAFASFGHWFAWRTILQYCHLVVMQRPGIHVLPSMDDFLKKRLIQDKKRWQSQAGGKILIQSVPQLAISSTDIRHRLLHAGQTQVQAVATMMPAKVYQQLKRFLA